MPYYGDEMEFCKECEIWYRKDNKWNHHETKKHKMRSMLSQDLIDLIFKKESKMK